MNHLPASPYLRLNQLLSGISTPKEDAKALMLHIGEPQRPVPDNVGKVIAHEAHEFGMYPPASGTIAFRQAVREWVHNRYDIETDNDIAVLPSCGGREALFQIALCTQFTQYHNKPDPVVLLPNPMYHVYQGAAKIAGYRAYPLDLNAQNGFIPDFSNIPEDILHNTVLCYICNPNNPTGSVMGLQQLQQIADDAAKYDFAIVADECYSEIYRQTPPPSFLQLLPQNPNLLQRLWVVNSLSKRSGTPGLRVGIVITHHDLSNNLQSLRGFSGAHVPPPLLSAAVKLLQDEQHVKQGRAYYNHLFDVVADVFTQMGCADKINLPEAGMFLWVNVKDGEAFAKKLWQEQHIKVMPGRYMCLAQEETAKPQPTSGDEYVRIAIVHEEKILRPALEKIAQFLLT
ncbi:MAG: aminotransferase class I/II-fold pyridoxal phosphate-dependent enzyme [Alphaproteobacteria bacterium]|nr:aminotransferase class I/II-fold pyridoxal phosphate-dependent enzyme [Alphaproteobacteria bacterium]